MNTMNTHEMVSALADGQLNAELAAQGLAALARDPEALEAWSTYHLIGDVLRSSDLAACSPAERFASRISQRLAAEPAITPDLEFKVRPPTEVRGQGLREAANQPVFRWKLVAGLASVAAVAATGWTLLASHAPSSGSQLVASNARGSMMLRDKRLDEFLAAHRELSGATALQMPSGFVRNASFDNSPAR